MKEIVVQNFDLSYDGMYQIKWSDMSFKVYLELNTILRMLEIEGYSYEMVDKKLKSWEPLQFNKVELILKGEVVKGKIRFLTSAAAEDYYNKRIYLIDVDLK
jgi:hypothetical protein